MRTEGYRNSAQEAADSDDAGGEEAELRAKPMTESKAVKSVLDKFGEKHGTEDVTKYYSKLDMVVVAETS